MYKLFKQTKTPKKPVGGPYVPPPAPIEYYHTCMIILDFMHQVMDPYHCLMFAVDPLTPLELLVSPDLQGSRDSKLTNFLSDWGQDAGCDLKQYQKDPFPMILLTKPQYEWIYLHSTAALRTDNGRFYFRARVQRDHVPYEVSPQTLAEIKATRKRITGQVKILKKEESEGEQG